MDGTDRSADGYREVIHSTASDPFMLPSSPDTPLLLHGDCLALLRSLPAASVDVVITDPPAGIGFMSKNWDSFAGYEPVTERGKQAAIYLGGDPLVRRAAELLHGLALSSRTDGLPVQAEALDVATRLLELTRAAPMLPAWARGFVLFMVDVWTEVDRVLKPGGWVCAWALPKTADLAGLAMRASGWATCSSREGWTIHENILHLFGSGFPKSHNVSKALDAMAGAEREVVGSKLDLPGYHLSDSHETATAMGGGSGLHADAEARLRASQITAPATPEAQRWDGWGTALAPGHEQWLLARKPTPLTYAKNVLQYGCGALNVGACGVEAECQDDSMSCASGAVRRASSPTPIGSAIGGVVGLPDVADETTPSDLSTDSDTCASNSGPTSTENTSTSSSIGRYGKRLTALSPTGMSSTTSTRSRQTTDLTTSPSCAVKTTHGTTCSSPTDTQPAQHRRTISANTSDASANKRWPKNVLLTEGGDGCPVAELDRQSGHLQSGLIEPHHVAKGSDNLAMSGPNQRRDGQRSHGDAGGASRFFPRFRYQAKAHDRTAGLRTDTINRHPTHKSVELMRWLVRLLAAKAEHTGGDPAIVLDPFMGSGTTGIACVAERVRFIGIERDPARDGDHDSFGVARSRILAAIGSPDGAVEANAIAPVGAQLGLL